MDMGFIGLILLALSFSFTIVFGIFASLNYVTITQAYGMTLIAYILLFYGMMFALIEDKH